MEFHEKLQELRKQKGLTQGQLAEFLFVSRTAVSKWEQGRGYPNIDSLKAIAKFFGVSIDELLSGDELLNVAEDDSRQTEKHILDQIFGLLDCSLAIFFFLPLFGQRAEEMVRAVSLLEIMGIASYLKLAYFSAIIGGAVLGILTLTMQNSSLLFWVKYKSAISLAWNGAGILLFIISLQPYAAALMFIFLIIKVVLMLKKR